MSSRTLLRTGVLLVGLVWAYWQAPTAVQRLRAWWSPQRASASDANPARDAAWEDLKRQARKRQEAKALAKQHKSPQGMTDVVLYSPDAKQPPKESRAMLVTPSKRPRSTTAPAAPASGGKAPAQEPGRDGTNASPKSNSPAADAERDSAANRSESAHEATDNAAGGAFGDGPARDRGTGDPAGVAVPARTTGDAPRNPWRSISRGGEPGGPPVFSAGQSDYAALWSSGGPYALRAYAGRVRLFAIVGPVGAACGPAIYEPSAVAEGTMAADDESTLP